uniref:Uncharacterized protein n=1 Tax=Anguilla anguilla TaxID=7936 RepID=A0A0E9W5E9_ANGAN
MTLSLLPANESCTGLWSCIIPNIRLLLYETRGQQRILSHTKTLLYRCRTDYHALNSVLLNVPFV